MDELYLTNKLESYLDYLCNQVSNRHVGSEGNHQATKYFEKVISSFGFKTSSPPFDCIDWEFGAVLLEVGGKKWNAHVSPYSLPCDIEAELVPVSNIDELENGDITSKIVLLHGDIAREQILPKNYVFYNPEEHQIIHRILEEKQPAALICATGKNPQLAGSMYPFPMFEDGDFDIPSVYMKDVEGKELLNFAGDEIHLSFESKRIPATGCNVIASKGSDQSNKILVFAHIDSKKDTPGALDDATGIITLLGTAELLKDYSNDTIIEIIAFNGEDYYSAPGQTQYLKSLGDSTRDIKLVINIDGAGFKDARTAFSLYNCPEHFDSIIKKTFDADDEFIHGEPWVQGDHSIFTMQGVPAVAITSGNFTQLCSEITHTPKDRPELADCVKLAKASKAISDILINLTE